MRVEGRRRSNRLWWTTCIAVTVLQMHLLAQITAARGPSGTLEGRVTFSGAAPAATVVAESGGSQSVLHLDRLGGLRYAVVYFPDAARSTDAPRATVTLTQHRFVFEPQVLAVRAGQTVRFTNDDPANHNVRSQDSQSTNSFSVMTPPGTTGAAVRRFAPTPQGQALLLTCDIHPWMAAWVYVFEHDLFAVTSADGRFRIEGVPPGRHRIAVRQPSGSLARDVAVDIRPGETARVDVAFNAGDLGMPTR